MSDISLVKAAALFPFIEEIVRQGQTVKISISGTSMVPFLRHGIDCVELTHCDYGNLRRTDIVLIRRNDGTYVMHRILRKKPTCFYMVGDAQEWVEGPIYPEQVMALVTSVWREDRQIDTGNRLWQLLSEGWLRLLPFRSRLLNIYWRLNPEERKKPMTVY